MPDKHISYQTSDSVRLKKQSGVVMAISLIMLLALTIIAVTGTEVTGLEEKMAANSKNTNIAFQAADAAERAAEQAIAAGTVSAASFSVANNGINGLYTTLAACQSACAGVSTCISACSTSGAQSSYYTTIDWNSTSTTLPYVAYTGGALTGVYQAPRYIIEQLATTTSTNSSGNLEAGASANQATTVSWYRITARGTGTDVNAVVILQSIFKQ